MKKLRYFRHSDRKGQFITPAGLKRAKRELPIEPYTDGFYGPLIRTAQTLAAFAQVLKWKLHIHEPIREICDEIMEDQGDTPEFLSAVKDGLNNFDAANVSFSRDRIELIQGEASLAVIQMFIEIEDGGYGLAVGHDPLISFAAQSLGWKEPRSLKTLEYIDFEQGDDGQIRFVAVGP